MGNTHSFWQTRFMKEIGADALLRGFSTPFASSNIHGVDLYENFCHLIPGCDICRDVKGDLTQIRHITPVGTLTTLARYSPEGDMQFVVEYEEEVDMIESLSPPPTGNVDVWEAQAQLGSQTGIIGGIEPTHFLNLTMQELRTYVETLLDRVNPRHYVLANSDSCPPGVSVEKFRLVTDIIQERS